MNTNRRKQSAVLKPGIYYHPYKLYMLEITYSSATCVQGKVLDEFGLSYFIYSPYEIRPYKYLGEI